jgi:hypothetical protein
VRLLRLSLSAFNPSGLCTVSKEDASNTKNIARVFHLIFLLALRLYLLLLDDRYGGRGNDFVSPSERMRNLPLPSRQ